MLMHILLVLVRCSGVRGQYSRYYGSTRKPSVDAILWRWRRLGFHCFFLFVSKLNDLGPWRFKYFPPLFCFSSPPRAVLDDDHHPYLETSFFFSLLKEPRICFLGQILLICFQPEEAGVDKNSTRQPKSRKKTQLTGARVVWMEH